MANPQPLSVAYQPGRVVLVILRDLLANKFWNTVTPGWETYNPSNAVQYQITLTDPLGLGQYTAPYPTAITDVVVTQFAYDSADLVNPIGSNEVGINPAAAATPLDSGQAVVAIINRALDALGVQNIVALDEDSVMANKAAKIFDNTRDSLLRSHYWKFANFSDTLALISAETVPNWLYLYAYPPKCFMIRKIFDQSCVNPAGDRVFDSCTLEQWLFSHPEFRYEEFVSPTTFQKSIACNITPAYIQYTIQVTDPNQWDQAFADAMVFSLAEQLAVPLTGNTDLRDKMGASARGITTEAKRIDAQEDNSRRPQQSSYQRSRM